MHDADESVRGVANVVVAIDNRVTGVGDRVAWVSPVLVIKWLGSTMSQLVMCTHGCANAQIGTRLHNKSPTQANHPVHQDKLEGGGEPAEERGSYHLSAFDQCPS